jgi:exodeoxyribonuclease VII large subunit
MEQIALNWEPERRYFTVSELTQGMRVVLGDHFTDIWVAGEISGARVPGSGHFYFTLKDEQAQVQCVCYKMTARYMKFKPQDGLAVLARGRVDFYDARGQVQFVVEAIEPQGFGALQLAFEQVKRKLETEGLFSSERKRALPNLPERIGIVTSPSGAVIQDILQILERRCPGRHIRLYPAQVQGDGAAEQIAAGIEYFSASGWAEVVVVARGGGSLEDLWAFNEERVARAIARSSVPVISAVGHETDFTIADFVADLRAPTPSAAAELLIATRASLLNRLDMSESKLRQAARLTIALLARRLHAVTVDSARLHRALGRRSQRVDELDYRLRDLIRKSIDLRKRVLENTSSRLQRRDVRLQFADVRRRLSAAETRLRERVRLDLSGWQRRLAPLEAHLTQLSPLKILERGYAIVQREGKIVKSPEDAPVGSAIKVRLAVGEIAAKVTKR